MQVIYILHGWAIGDKNQEKWQPFIDLLKEAGYKVNFLKIPGLSVPSQESWELQDFVDWLEGQIKEKSGVILLGHSFGSQLSIRYTSQHPKQISKLILIDSGGIKDRAIKVRIKRKVFLVLAKTGKNFLKSPVFRHFLYKMARETDYLKAPPAQRKSMSNVLRDEILKDLPKIKCKTQIIWGQNDKTTPLKHAFLLHQGISHSKVQIIQEARHSPQFTHAKEVSEIVINFINEKK